MVNIGGKRLKDGARKSICHNYRANPKVRYAVKRLTMLNLPRVKCQYSSIKWFKVAFVWDLEAHPL
jgi:hypothetical protein